ncbi:ABC-F family ATP-binding cassette domain-containing protein [Anaerolentibacter hominis]|uniref:ABC-F family ATP-binding cassette domain-containing protein n=1 Tax=Anaerolentibacter hominis TaxID=3079009 RepID=UPI0031B8671D
MILACQGICKSFGTDKILENISFHINEREKAAVIGMNGAGKSTLLKIIMGELAADAGEVILAKDTTIGYLAQHQDLTSERSIYEELLSVKADVIALNDRIRTLENEMASLSGPELKDALDRYARLNHEFEQQNGYAYKSEVTGVLKGLGFEEEEFTKSVSTLSGGQKTRVFLGKLLLSRPDIILLDEPTNHLDLVSIAWLENYLLNYKGTVVIVSHDRYFLDKVVGKVVEIERCSASCYIGNYTDYAKKKAMLRDAQIKQYLNQQREIRHQEEVIAKLRSFNREKSIRRAESREKLLNKMDVLDKPVTEEAQISIELTPSIVSGTDVLDVEGLAKAFGSQTLFWDLSFSIKREEKVAIIGKNGTGKTTILKIINGLLPADAGDIRLGSKVKIGYYDQEHHVLNMDKTVFDEIQDEYPWLDNTKIRNLLASFLFTGDDVFKRIGDLSGGERGRVSLAKLMLSEANLLILDEPTNHLDITSKEILENALNHYTGTVLYVSHDRYFINKTATRILDLTQTQLINYLGNYDYYLEKKEELEARLLNQEASCRTDAREPDGKLTWQQKKEEQAARRRIENRLKKIEEEIQALEEENEKLDAALSLEENYTNPARLIELNNRKEEITSTLETLFSEWEELEG